jgi:spore coat protein U-like protein
MKRFRLIALTLAFGTLGVATQKSASAGSASTSLSVSATVVASCTIATSALAFGNYDPVVVNHATNLDAAGSVTVACTSGSVTTIGMGQGSFALPGSTGIVPLRQMGTGANRLAYFLFQDALRTTVWGDSGAATFAYTSAGMAAQTFPVYGRVTAAQDVATGSYADTVTATINF